MGQCQVSSHRLPGSVLLLRSQAEKRIEEPGGSGSRNPKYLRKAGDSLARTKAARRRGGRRSFRQRFCSHHFQRKAERGGRDLLFVLRSREGTSRTGEEVPGFGGAVYGQF